MKNIFDPNSNASNLPFTTKEASQLTNNKVWWKRRTNLNLINIVAKCYTISNFVLLAVGSSYIAYKRHSQLHLMIFYALEIFSLFSLFRNWILFSSPHIVTTTTADLGAEEEKYCSYCETQVASNSHHCPLCNACIVAKDHHCFFLGKCVDKFNQKYFIRFCFHASWSCAVACCYFLTHTHSNYRNIMSLQCVYYFVPFSGISLVVGDVGLSEFLFVTGCSVSFSTSLFTCVMYLLQTRTDCELGTAHDLLVSIKKSVCKFLHFLCKMPLACQVALFDYILRIKRAY